jgi:hypothetical protein
VQRFCRRAIDAWQWRRQLRRLARSFPAPTPEQINDLCIVCRMPMAVTDSRMLPCRHCCHLGCIHQWTATHTSCPLCGYSLVPPLDPLSDPWAARCVFGIGRVFAGLFGRGREAEIREVLRPEMAVLEQGGGGRNGGEVEEGLVLIGVGQADDPEEEPGAVLTAVREEVDGFGGRGGTAEVEEVWDDAGDDGEVVGQHTDP